MRPARPAVGRSPVERRRRKRGFSISFLTIITLGIIVVLVVGTFVMLLVSSEEILPSLLGLVGSLVLLVIAGRYLLVKIMRPVNSVALAARQLSDGQLETRVPEGGRGEIRTLVHSFNRMAVALEQRSLELTELNLKLESSIESAEEGSRLKSSFLANMSHEIRTPLNAVLGMTALLKKTGLDAEQQVYLRTAEASGDVLMEVIDDILDISKIEAGRLEIDPHDFNLVQAIDAVSDVLGTVAQQKGLQLHTYIGPDVPPSVKGDRGRLMQILTNLVANAIKFTVEGEVVVEVARGPTGPNGVHVLITVRDSGIGITDEALMTSFDAFTQADVSTTRRFGGSGLGLAISHELTELMGGSIKVESETGVGSTFTIDLPFIELPGDETAPAAQPGLRGLRVLIADQKRTGREILDAYLTGWEMATTTSADGSSTLDLLHDAAVEGTPYDLLLLDAALDPVGGSRISERVQESPSLRATQVIMLANSSIRNIRSSEDSDLTWLPRPISKSLLLETISSVREIGSRPAVSQSRADTWIPGTGRILMAEDNDVNQFFLGEVLAAKGYSFEAVSNGREALDALTDPDKAFDLILMDCQMPEMDGYDATRELRAREEQHGLTRVPVIAMTAHAMEWDREKCLAAGMDGYLTKPLRIEELDAVLSDWL